MNNSINDRFSVQTSAEANYLTISLDEPVRFDSIALSMLQEDRPDFLLPVQIKTLNDRQSLRYKLINAVSLQYSLEKSMTRAAYIKLALDLLTPFVKCRDWFLDYHYICIDPRYILRDKRSGSFLFVYMPEYSLKNEDEEIIDFFESILDYIDISDDREFQISIMHYFRNGGITLSELYQMFLTERGKTSATETAPRQTPRTAPVQQTPVKHETVKPAPVEEPAPVKKEEPKKAPAKSEPESGKRGFIDWFLGKNGSDGKKSSDAQSDEIDSTGSDDSGDMNESLNVLFGSSPKKAPKQPKKSEKPAETKPQKQSPFGFQKKETVAEPARSAQSPATQPVYQTEPQPYPVNDAADEETNIVGLSDSNRVYLELIDSMFPNVPKAIDIDMSKPYVTIGRATADTTGLDIAFPESCKGISRHHARITNKDGGLVITDLGSTYFTVLNGQRLVPNAEYPLTDGSVLEFVQSKPIRYRVHC